MKSSSSRRSSSNGHAEKKGRGIFILDQREHGEQEHIVVVTPVGWDRLGAEPASPCPPVTARWSGGKWDQ